MNHLLLYNNCNSIIINQMKKTIAEPDIRP